MSKTEGHGVPEEDNWLKGIPLELGIVLGALQARYETNPLAKKLKRPALQRASAQIRRLRSLDRQGVDSRNDIGLSEPTLSIKGDYDVVGLDVDELTRGHWILYVCLKGLYSTCNGDTAGLASAAKNLAYDMIGQLEETARSGEQKWWNRIVALGETYRWGEELPPFNDITWPIDSAN